jgi:hypothetical protein
MGKGTGGALRQDSSLRFEGFERSRGKDGREGMRSRGGYWKRYWGILEAILVPW